MPFLSAFLPLSIVPEQMTQTAMAGLELLSTLHFKSPWVLAFLAIIPVCWVIYRNHALKKLQQTALYYSQVALIQQLKQRPHGMQNLIAPLLLTVLAVLLILSAAQPAVIQTVSTHAVDMMLVMDISISMKAKDIKPSRIEAAKAAAVKFVKSLPDDVRIGLEWFAGSTYVLSSPTDNHQEIIDYIQALKVSDLKPRTEIGSALNTALMLLKKEEETETQKAQKPLQTPLQNEQKAPKMPKKANEPVTQSESQARSSPDQVIVLISDGDSREGYPWQLASKKAKEDNVTVYTIGIGSQAGGEIEYLGNWYPVNFDEQILREIARLSAGRYYRVFSPNDFDTVYKRVKTKSIRTETKEQPVGFLFSGLALLTLLVFFFGWVLV
ncbi:MAG: VWA domain-containing protein [Cyanobacteria bacterium P01_H01_bin.74]